MYLHGGKEDALESTCCGVMACAEMAVVWHRMNEAGCDVIQASRLDARM